MRSFVAAWVGLSLVGCSSPAPDAAVPEAGLAEDVGPNDTGWLLPEPDTDPPPFAERPAPILDFSPVVTPTKAPPALSGGTLLALRDDRTVVAADSDRDRVVVVDLVEKKVLATIALPAGSEPGRLVEDTHGAVHVVLRRGGGVASIDLATKAVRRRDLCPVPRGIAFDDKTDSLVVACLGGELVVEPLSAGARTVHVVAPDLRDVAIDGDAFMVTRHRSAELLRVDRTTFAVTVRTPVADPKIHAPNTAARLRPRRGGGFFVLHQRSSILPVGSLGGAVSYGGQCGPVHVAVTTFGEGPAVGTFGITNAAVPLDLVEAQDGKSVLVVAPGAMKRGGAQLFKVPLAGSDSTCTAAADGGRIDVGDAIAIDRSPGGHLVVQTREPSTLLVDGVTVPLGGESVLHTGHAVFHSTTLHAAVACASCHPEGGDDGHVWRFERGNRRTQSLRGGVLATAPFHWDGALADFVRVMDESYGKQMGGGMLPVHVLDATARWVDALPSLPRPVADAASVARGKALFEGAAQGCATCHAGPLGTDNASVTLVGNAFQVPALVGVAYRGPWLHDGCAPTLDAALDGCGLVDRHGKVSHLDAAARADLLRYLGSL